MRGVLYAANALIRIIKICIFASFVLFCPQFFLLYSSRYYEQYRVVDKAFKLGIENIGTVDKKIFTVPGTQSRVALITNQAGVDQQGRYTSDLLSQAHINIKKIIIPTICSKKKQLQTDAVSTLPIPVEYLYGFAYTCKKDLFKECDLILFDVPDISLAYDQYIAVIKDILAIVMRSKKPLVVLDRPNLVSSKIEGVLGKRSDMLLPLRSGMSGAELIQYINKKLFSSQAELRIVPMSQYNRLSNEQKELLDYLMRMKLPACMSAMHSFVGILSQVQPFDIGIGTDHAFECLLLPESLSFERQKWYELQINLRNNGIESKFYRYFNSAKKEYYHGLQFNMHTLKDYSMVNSLLSVLMFFKQNGLALHFSTDFDAAIGTPLIREVVLGIKSYKQLQEKLNTDVRAFFEQAQDAFMYTPFPELLFV